MDLLNHLLGGPQRPEYENFVDRYEQGDPWDGIADDEAVQRYQQVAPRLAPDVYEQSAEEAFRRLTPEQRLHAEIDRASLARISRDRE